MASPSDPAQDVESTRLQPDDMSNDATGEMEQAIDEDITNGEDQISDAEETADLAALGAVVRDQDDLERDIGQQADQLLAEQAIERERKRLQKTLKEKERMQTAVKIAETNLAKPAGSATKNKYRAEIEHYNALIANLDNDIAQISKRIDDRKKSSEQDGETLLEDGANKRLPGESQREFLIRTGKITPFSKMRRQLLKTSSSLGELLLLDEDQQDEDEAEEDQAEAEAEASIDVGPKSHQYLLAPGFDQEDTSAAPSTAGDTEDDAALARRLQDEEDAQECPAKRRRLTSRRHTRATSEAASTVAEESDAAYVPGLDESGVAAVGRSGDAGESEDDDAEGDFTLATAPPVKRSRKGKQKQKAIDDAEDGQEDLAGIDDGNEQVYQARLQSWVERRSAARRRAKERRASTQQDADESANGAKPETREVIDLDQVEEAKPEWQMPHPTRPDAEFEGGFRIPVMKQWVNEFHRWWPPLRVSILHTSGSGMLDVGREERYEERLEAEDYSSKKTLSKGQKAAKRILDKVTKHGHVLVTTYSGLQTYAELLIPTDWEYAVLDEGHKIRNPNTAITIYCKELCTHNRVILSGTPMQNNLTELWSLFDFVFPMRLGTLVNFKNQFEIPIKHGGYANASNLQVETAMKCAETLKDAISPYLLQRFKVDVAADLPKKSERVLFCKLTKLQREAYQWFLDSEDMKSILNGKRQALYGVDILRKISNHPDLVEHRTLSKKSDYNYGDGRKSGKMQVRQTFQLKDLHDLFTLGDSADGQTETGNIFKGTEVNFKQGNLPTPPEDGSAPAGDDLSKVAGISRQEDFRGEDDEQEDSSKGASKEDRMLSSIFAGNGVASVQDHDAIINGRKTVRADPAIIQREAKRVAAEAARELERAGEIARSLPAGVPTWTGQVGTAGRSPSPPPRRGGMRGGMRGGRGGRGGPSSSSVLANLQNRHIGSAANTAVGTASSASSRDATPVARGRAAVRNAPQGKDFLKLIRDFMIQHNGVVPAQMLVDHFDRMCRGSQERTMQFKEMLKTIATLEKGSTPGRSKWRLKEDYRPPSRA
ncbi:DNA repair protein rhp26 [Pseudocercospora fuligena]|uniref:DNA repair protein rhp26 n=1 Tax=Pseudocercospora fuligena TaxID=685502 RepID=A0A8H6REQ8_9PEZI|nr:DNA repair protein rhp26 [Pseudocercospora fuligena]